MPEFEQYEGRGPPPPMVNDYNHGRMQEEEGYGMEEYEMPPEPPIPEPIIPTAMYYDLPAGLMAPLVGVRFLSVIILLEGGDREGVVRWLWAANLLRDQSLFIIFFWGGVKDFKGGDHIEFRGDMGGSVVANRVQRRNYGKLTANGGDGKIDSVINIDLVFFPGKAARR